MQLDLSTYSQNKPELRFLYISCQTVYILINIFISFIYIVAYLHRPSSKAQIMKQESVGTFSVYHISDPA